MDASSVRVVPLEFAHGRGVHATNQTKVGRPLARRRHSHIFHQRFIEASQAHATFPTNKRDETRTLTIEETIMVMATLPTLTAEELARHIQTRTYRRLRQLSVTEQDGRLHVSAKARSYHVRQLAELAAHEMVPSSQLDLAIQVQVFSATDWLEVSSS
jgi:hypothetical protein